MGKQSSSEILLHAMHSSRMCCLINLMAWAIVRDDMCVVCSLSEGQGSYKIPHSHTTEASLHDAFHPSLSHHSDAAFAITITMCCHGCQHQAAIPSAHSQTITKEEQMVRNVALMRLIVLASTNTYTNTSDHNKGITCAPELAR